MNSSLFTESDAMYKASVMHNTWGHLDAKPGEIYPCKLVVACDGRQILIVSSTCKACGPAFHYDSEEYFFKKLAEKGKEGVFIFEGTYQMYKNRPKDADTICFFKGNIRKAKIK